MRDLILSILLIAITYIGSAGFAIVLFRIFFPLKVKAAKENKLTFTYSRNKTTHFSTNNKVHLLSVSGRKDWVKVRS
jgi:hypothetical protein